MPKVQMNLSHTFVIRGKVNILQQSVMPFEVAVRTNSDGSEGKSLSNGEIFWLQYSTFSYGGEGFNKKIK